MDLHQLSADISHVSASSKATKPSAEPQKLVKTQIARPHHLTETASSRAFAIVELLDGIFTHLLDDPTTLARAQRVNSDWHDLLKKRYAVGRFAAPRQERDYVYYRELDGHQPEILYIVKDVQPPWPEGILCLQLIKTHPILKGRMVKEKGNESLFHDEFVNPDFRSFQPGNTMAKREGLTDDRVYHTQRAVYELEDGSDQERAIRAFNQNFYGVKSEGNPGVTLGQIRDRIDKETTKLRKNKSSQF
ncbi:hypothetical protein MRB53_039987 [Persea americana]|nr:hypothetical protein MRB53_039987 [Persea americana]